MKKTLSLLLVFAMLLGVCSAAFAETEWLPISDGTYPIVPEGESVTIRVGIVKNGTWGGDPENLWLWNYLSKLMNINFEFTVVLDAAVTERKNLMFAANELPDVLIGYGLTAAELVTYGQVDGQLLKLNDYINETYMPNLMQWLEATPALMGMMTAPDGGIYSLPNITREMNPGDAANIPAMYINQAWLEANGKERPTTLEELTALLRTYKEMNPGSYPFAAAANSGPAGLGLLLNAMGYLCDKENIFGSAITLRNGEVAMACYDDIFVEYLKVVNEWYKEELITPDYFTLDQSAVYAAVSEDKALVYCGLPYLANAAYESFSRWSALTPLTSQWNDTPLARTTVQSQIGGFVVSSNAQHVDVIMKMADWFFSGLGGFYQWYGPQAGDEDMIMGMEGVMGWVVDDEGVGTFVAVNEGVAGSNAAYILGNIQSYWVAFGNNSNWLGRESEGLTDQASTRQYLGGHTPTGYLLDPTLGYASASLSSSEYVLPYIQYDYPLVVYMDEETTLVISDLASVLNSYIEQEVAKFMTGRRDLSEFDAFRSELKNLGIEELIGYYKTAYEAYQDNLTAE